MSEYKTLRALVRWKRDSNRLSGSVAVSDGSILRIRAVRRTRVTGLWTWEVLRNSIGSGLSLDIEAAPQAFIHFQTGEGDFEVPLPELLEAKCLDYLSGAVTVELLPPGAGTARILPPRVAAGSRETIVLEYTVGEGGMAAGGGIRLCFSLRSRWKTFGRLAASYVNNNVTAEELEDRDYTSRYASSGVVLTVTGPEGISETSDALPRLTGGSVTVRVNGNALLPGDVIRLEFRDAVVSEETNRAFHMIVFADTDGDGVFREIEKSPRLDICPASARYLHIVAPSAVSPKEEFAARIQVMDKHMNPVDCFAGEVRFLEGAVKGLPQGLVFSKEGHPHAVLRGLRLRKPAPARLVAGGSVVGRSNYILPVDHTMKIYWGELHEHTIVSDGYESPAFTYEYARDVACLDFCAVCDHAHHTTQAGWERSTQATRDFHQPGRFVTFFAYEWGNAHGGDYNIYAKEQIPCLHTGLGTGFPMPFLGEHSVERARRNLSVEALWEELRGMDVIAIPHHLYHIFTGDSSVGMNVYGGQALEPVVELFSNWGCSEYRDCPHYPERGKIDLAHFPHFVTAEKERFLFQDMLALGYRVGVIGGSDAHISRPGFLSGRWPSKPGLTAVYAPELTRDALFDAIRKRRCYATTGKRIFVEFKLNDSMMGDVARLAPDEPPVISYRIGGAERLLEVQVIKDGKALHRWLCEDDTAAASFTDVTPGRRDSYYYLRVIQADGEMAWSSPIWVARGNA